MHRFSNKDLKELILPLFLEQLLIIFVGLADTFMISFAGDAAVSGVSLVNMLGTFFIYVFTALASGGAVIISQYIGRKDHENADHAAGQLTMILAVSGLVCMIFVIIFNRQILGLLFGRIEDGVMQACITYQWISALSYIPLGVYNAGAAICRSISRTEVTLKVSVVSNIVNLAGNAIGIFILHAGVAGVAWPTFIARLIAAGMIIDFCRRKENPVRLRKAYVFIWDSEAVRRILRVAVPGSIENGTFQLIKVLLSSITALFGTAQIAANGIAQTFWLLSALFIVVMGPVFITVIGQCMGAGEVAEAEYYFKKLTLLTFIGSTAWNALILALAPLMLRFYPLSQEVTGLVFRLVLIHNVFNSFAWPVGGAVSHGLRAAGDVRFAMCVTIGSTIFVRMLLSVVFGIYMNLGVIGIAYAMVCDWIVRSLLIGIRYKSGKWKKLKVI